jgi:hypothetical protein
MKVISQTFDKIVLRKDPVQAISSFGWFALMDRSMGRVFSLKIGKYLNVCYICTTAKLILSIRNSNNLKYISCL